MAAVMCKAIMADRRHVSEALRNYERQTQEANAAAIRRGDHVEWSSEFMEAAVAGGQAVLEWTAKRLDDSNK